MILTASAMAVKLIGALFKIPLTNILGGSGMAYFMTAYDLFSPVYALSIAGLPVAVSRLVSENVAKGRYRDIKKVFRLSFLMFFLSGIVGSLIMLLGAGPFAEAVGNPDAVYAVSAMAPAIFFGCILSAIRGYYQGLSNMLPTALSQIVEAAAKLILGIGLALLITEWGIRQFSQTGRIFGKPAASLTEAKYLVLPYAAAGAILGVTLSTMCGAVYLLCLYKIKGDGISRQRVKAAPRPGKASEIFRSLIAIAFPVCIGSLISHLTTIIDLASIVNRLNRALEQGAGIIYSMYEGMLPEGVNIPLYLYGSYTGLAVSLFNLVPSITAAIGISALPTVTQAWSGGNRKKVEESIRSVLSITALLAIPMGLGLSALSGPILDLLFSARPQESALAAPLLRVMGIAAIFIAITNPISSMLQAVGRADIPVKLMIAGVLLKASCNWILVADPRINIKGAPVGTLLCYGSIFIFSLYFLCRETGARIDLSFLTKPLAAGIACICAARACWIITAELESRLFILISIGIGGAVYVLSLILLRGISQNDLFLLPNGEKIAKRLAKISLLE